MVDNRQFAGIIGIVVIKSCNPMINLSVCFQIRN